MYLDYFIFAFYFWVFGVLFVLITGVLNDKSVNVEYTLLQSFFWHLPASLFWPFLFLTTPGRNLLKEYRDNFRSL